MFIQVQHTEIMGFIAYQYLGTPKRKHNGDGAATLLVIANAEGCQVALGVR